MKTIFKSLPFLLLLLCLGCSSDDDNAPSELHWRKVAVGYYHTLAIRSDGTLWAWGSNEHGQLGDGTQSDRLSPVQIGTGNDWDAIGAGQYHSAALKSDGHLWTWGRNEFGQLGDNSTAASNTPIQIGSDTYSHLAVGKANNLVLKTDGTIWAWGANELGQVGNGNPGESVIVPMQIGTANNWTYVAAADYHCFAKKTDNSLWAWGMGENGQLGNGQSVNKSIPTIITTISTANWTSLDGGQHTVGLRTNGSLWITGSNFQGEQGNGTTGLGTSVFQQLGSDTWSMVSATLGSSAGIKSNGTLWVWGYNGVGQLGLGDLTDRNVPTQIGSETNWKLVEIGWSNGVALTNNNVLWSWGYPASIGNGNASGPTNPVIIPCPQ